MLTDLSQFSEECSAAAAGCWAAGPVVVMTGHKKCEDTDSWLAPRWLPVQLPRLQQLVSESMVTLLVSLYQPLLLDNLLEMD